MLALSVEPEDPDRACLVTRVQFGPGEVQSAESAPLMGRVLQTRHIGDIACQPRLDEPDTAGLVPNGRLGSRASQAGRMDETPAQPDGNRRPSFRHGTELSNQRLQFSQPGLAQLGDGRDLR